MITLKSSAEIEMMRKAGQVVAEVLAAMKEQVAPGVTTGQLDTLARSILERRGATPSFLGYPPGGAYPFPAAICASVNEELVHGVPGDRVLQDGDIISVDVGAIVDGFHGDAAVTLPVGDVKPEAQELIEAAQGALACGIEAMRSGNRSGDVSAAIQVYAEGLGYNVVREYTGHGIGRAMHEDPQVPNYGEKGRGVELKSGMTIALEPMLLAGDSRVRVLDDHWTVVSADGRLTAHCEHTIAVGDGRGDVLTLP